MVVGWPNTPRVIRCDSMDVVAEGQNFPVHLVLTLTEEERGNVLLRVYSSQLPGDGVMSCRLRERSRPLQDQGENLRSAWNRAITAAADHASSHFPNETLARLGRMGADLYLEMFDARYCVDQRHGPQAVERCQEVIRRCIHSGQATISIISEQILLPWGMLYTPLREEDTSSDDWMPRRERFWACSVRMHHDVGEAPPYPTHEIPLDPHFRFGLSVHSRIEKDHLPEDMHLARVDHRYVGSLKIPYTHRARRVEVRTALEPSTPADHLWYVFAHAAADGVELLDGVILQRELKRWMDGRSACGTILFLNVCSAGELRRDIDWSMTRVAIDSGARSVIAPHTVVRPYDAATYAHDFLHRFLDLNEDIGLIVRDLANLHFPWGVVYAAFRGMATHLVPMAAIALDESAAQQSLD